MARRVFKGQVFTGLDYLHNRPIKIHWKVVAGGELSPAQKYDLVFDDNDLKIRQIYTKDNITYLQAAQTR